MRIMDPDATKSDNLPKEDKDPAAFNSTILNYYRKFGKKRGLEKFFVSDTPELFWRSMENQNDSSDSNGKKTESPTEICRISIKCSIPDEPTRPEAGPSNSPTQEAETQSPPIVTDEIPGNISRLSEAESELNTSQKSIDPSFDTSMNKPLSPTGSITYHRKLEWDSLADVGYDNESHRKSSASGLSTLEKLALKQQYTNNDKLESTLGLPTAESTPLDENRDIKSKLKSNKNVKTTKIHKRDVVKVNVPHSDNIQSVNFNLTKHISVNVDKDSGAVTANISKSPEKVSVETEITPKLQYDKEIQTTLLKDSPKRNKPTSSSSFNQPASVIINLNSLRRRLKTKKIRTARSTRRKRINIKKKPNMISQEKSGDQVSDAESFEYMPGHIYNQNQHEQSDDKNRSVAGNKSSLESSGVLTTESSQSKTSIKSFSKDLEKGVELLNNIIQQHQDNSKLKRKLVRDIVTKLINSKYRGDDSAEFKSGNPFSSTTLGLETGDYKNSTTTSTSDGNNTSNPRPRKSILRMDKFDSTAVASTTQSVPNLAIASTSDVNVPYKREFSGTDGSSKGRNSSESLTTSEELYQKYLEVRRKEQLYKKYLIEKEMFLKKKLVGYEGQSLKPNVQNNKINELMKDLTTNNYDRGDADILKDKDLQNKDYVRRTRSHSVFTLSSGNSNKKPNSDENKQDMRLKLRREIEKDPVAGTSRDINICSCQCHSVKIDVTDSAVQVNEQYPNNVARQHNTTKCEPKFKKISGELLTNTLTGELKYVCFCANGCGMDHEVPDNFLIYKCSRLSDQATQNDDCDKNKLHKDLGKPSVSSISSNTSKEIEVQTDAAGINFGNEKNVCACVQTNINCNPKLSDPSFSDLNIINETCSQTSKATQTTLKVNKNKGPGNSDEIAFKSCSCKENAVKERCTRDFICQTEQNNSNDDYTIALADTNIDSLVDMKDTAKKSDNIQVKKLTSQGVNAETNECTKRDNFSRETSKKIKPGILRIRSSSSDNITDKKQRTCSEKAKCYSTTTTPRTHEFGTQLKKQKEDSNRSCSCEKIQPKPTENKDLDIPCSLKVALRTKSPNRKETCRSNYCTFPAQTVKSNKLFTRRNTDSNVTLAYNCNSEQADCENESTSQPTIKEVDKTCKSSASSSRKSCTDESNTPDKQTSSSQRRKDESEKSKGSSKSSSYGDPIMDMIEDITRRYSKRDAVKNNKKKCFKEIMTVLNYLVDTDDSGDMQALKTEESSSCNSSRKKRDSTTNCSPVRLVDKGVQPTTKKNEKVGESSDVCGSDIPKTSTNSQASKLLNKIQRQCERYTQRRGRSSQREKKFESTSSTSDSYARCNKEQYCNCNPHAHCLCSQQKEPHSCKVPHKCKNIRPKVPTDKAKNKCVAYNLIIQTSDGLASDEKTPDKNRPPLRNIVVKVPSKRKTNANSKPNFNTDYADKYTSVNKPFKTARSRSLPGESDFSSNDDAFRRAKEFTVRHYLEKNRPDFVERTTQRQDCLKIINEARSNEYRKLLSLRLARQPDLNEISVTDLRELASALGIHLKNKIPAPNFISEKEMKKHSEKIYKKLPEVVRKKEEMKKERIKKTNLIMASLFKKNLQKRTLRGTVNVSNYSTVIRI